MQEKRKQPEKEEKDDTSAEIAEAKKARKQRDAVPEGPLAASKPSLPGAKQPAAAPQAPDVMACCKALNKASKILQSSLTMEEDVAVRKEIGGLLRRLLKLSRGMPSSAGGATSSFLSEFDVDAASNEIQQFALSTALLQLQGAAVSSAWAAGINPDGEPLAGAAALRVDDCAEDMERAFRRQFLEAAGEELGPQLEAAAAEGVPGDVLLLFLGEMSTTYTPVERALFMKDRAARLGGVK
jgi:hypothetical protein